MPEASNPISSQPRTRALLPLVIGRGATRLARAGLAGLPACLALSSLVPSTATAAASCPVTSIVIEAAGTQYLEPPRFQVFLDGKQVGQIDVTGVDSHAATPEASIAEVKAAAATARPFSVDLGGNTSPKSIEIRYVNDKWGTPDQPGDRNLFVRSVTVNGVKVPDGQLKADVASHGITDATGTALYQNGSLWVTGPLPPDCN